MDEMQTHNRVILCGTPLSSPVFSHASRLEPFYTFPLEVARLSGTVDTINVLLREELLPDLKPSRAGLIRIAGEVRSFNNHSGEGSKLVISVFARELSPPETPVWVNEVELTGTLCKSPNRRTTPMGREICDLMLAVNRLYGRSDYLPCIVWGQNARRAALWDVGTRVHLLGRIQSREYIKISTGRQCAGRRTKFPFRISRRSRRNEKSIRREISPDAFSYEITC